MMKTTKRTLSPSALVSADGDVVWFLPINLGHDPQLNPRSKIETQLDFGIKPLSDLLRNPEEAIQNRGYDPTVIRKTSYHKKSNDLKITTVSFSDIIHSAIQKRIEDSQSNIKIFEEKMKKDVENIIKYLEEKIKKDTDVNPDIKNFVIAMKTEYQKTNVDMENISRMISRIIRISVPVHVNRRQIGFDTFEGNKYEVYFWKANLEKMKGHLGEWTDVKPEAKKIFDDKKPITINFCYNLENSDHILVQGTLNSNLINVNLPMRPRFFNPFKKKSGLSADNKHDYYKEIDEALMFRFPEIFQGITEDDTDEADKKNFIGLHIQSKNRAFLGFQPGYDSHIIEELGAVECGRGFGFCHFDPVGDLPKPGDDNYESVKKNYNEFIAMCIMNPVLLAEIFAAQARVGNIVVRCCDVDEFVSEEIDIRPGQIDPKLNIDFVATKQESLSHFHVQVELLLPPDAQPNSVAKAITTTAAAGGNCVKISGTTYLFVTPAGQYVTQSFQQGGIINWNGLQAPPAGGGV
jgi:hypothetical protein